MPLMSKVDLRYNGFDYNQNDHGRVNSVRTEAGGYGGEGALSKPLFPNQLAVFCPNFYPG